MFDEFFDDELQENNIYNPVASKAGECKIYIDNRELMVIDKISRDLKYKFDRTNIYVEPLQVGDYLIISPDDTVEFIIERKTPDDLAQSLTDGRINTQIPELRDQDNSMVVIIGNPFDLSIWPDSWSEIDSITRFIYGLTVKTSPNGNRVLMGQVPGIDQFIVLLDYIAGLIEEGRLMAIEDRTIHKFKYANKTDYKDPRVIANVRLSMIAMIPKIGKVKAQAILEHFNWNMEEIFNASINDIIKADIKGVGKTLAERIFSVFHS